MLTLFSNLFKKLYLPALDALIIFIGLFYLKDFWANIYFNDPDYYKPSFLYFNVPLYISIWIFGIYISGGYDFNQNVRKLSRGLLFGTILLAAVYGFLDLAFRSSRILIILGAIWALLSTIILRFVIHFVKYKDFGFGREKTSNLVIVGSAEESQRVVQLLHQAEQQKNFIGTVAPSGIDDSKKYLSELNQLDEVVHIYQIDELIFCSKDIEAQDIMSWMTKLGPDYAYKIVPKESLSIIGSASKNSAGELYTIDIRFQIVQAENKRNKRVMDILISILLLVSLPFWVLFSKQKGKTIRNLFEVLSNKKSWVSYIPSKESVTTLPKIKSGIFSPLDALQVKKVNEPTIQRLNFLYAKDYTLQHDLDIIWKAMFN